MIQKDISVHSDEALDKLVLQAWISSGFSSIENPAIVTMFHAVNPKFHLSKEIGGSSAGRRCHRYYRPYAWQV